MIGMAAVFAVSRYTGIHFLWYNVVGAVTVLVSGLVITALSGGPATRAGAAGPREEQMSGRK
jgi:hypothetical protein